MQRQEYLPAIEADDWDQLVKIAAGLGISQEALAKESYTTLDGLFRLAWEFYKPNIIAGLVKAGALDTDEKRESQLKYALDHFGGEAVDEARLEALLCHEPEKILSVKLPNEKNYKPLPMEERDSVLTYAVSTQDPVAVRILLKHGAKTNIPREKDGQNETHALGFILNFHQKGETPAFTIEMNAKKSYAILELLLEHGSDPALPDKEGNTFIKYLADAKTALTGRIESAKDAEKLQLQKAMSWLGEMEALVAARQSDVPGGVTARVLQRREGEGGNISPFRGGGA